MFGMFGNKKQELNNKLDDVARFITSSLNVDGVAMVHLEGAREIGKEAFELISDNDLINCQTNVAGLFAMMVTADSAFKDNEVKMAKRISGICKIIATEIMKPSNEIYNDLEFTMVNNSVEFMKNIDGYN